MPSTHLLIAFFATTAIFAFVPGPSMLYAAARTLAGGRAAGLMAALGIHVGGYAHVAAAAAGLSLLFRAVPTLYLAVKLAGACYLIWLGIGLFRSSSADSAVASSPGGKSGRRAFVQSITIEVLNPKTALFFLAFLPQFVDPQAGSPLWLQLLLLGTVVNLMFSAVDIACVLVASVVVRRLSHTSGAQRLMRRAGGSILIGLGARLALEAT